MVISRSRERIRRQPGFRSFTQRALEALESRVLLSGNSYTIGVFSFTGGADGAGPFGGLVADSAGNLYGTAVSGGANGLGSVFELPLGASGLITLHSFTGSNGDGANPYAGLTIDQFGNLFGTTFAGGAAGDGTVFEIQAGMTTPVILYSFSGADGANPYASVTVDSSDNIFGTTTVGGASGFGTVFKISSIGVFSLLHSFDGTGDGKTPFGALTLNGTDLYGTTFAGASSGDGTVFKISGGVFSTVHVFTGDPDGSGPTGILAIDGGGNIFGTTSAGGDNNDGTIFGIVASSSTLATLYSFAGGIDGSTPFAGMTFDTNGNLFGTTYRGGAFGDGTVFEVPFDGVTPETLHSFASSDGANPYAGILVSPTGDLFGATTGGGATKHGTIFELSPTVTTHLTVGQQPDTVQAGAKPTFAIDLKKVDEVNNTSDDSSVTISIVSGPDGAILGGTTTVQARSGVATFTNLQLNRAGTYTLAASDGALDPVTLDTIVVDPGPAAKLAFSQQPTAFAAGQTITPSVAVEIEDALGNVITTSNSMVTLKIGSGPATALLTGTLTEQAVDGVATFSDLSLTKAGTYMLAASSGTFTVLKSASFIVTPDMSTAHFVITQQPGDAIVGKKLSPVISLDVQDQFGNPISVGTGQLLASLVVINYGGNATSAQLTGTTVANFSKGLASFGNLFISQPGDYQVQISGAGLAPITTNTIHSFFVPTHLGFTQQPALQTTAGSTFTSIVVSILDATNRVDITNSSVVTLSLKGNGTLNGTLSVAAINGVATFTGLSLDQAGSYTLAAASGSLTISKSAGFKIVPDATTAHLALLTAPAASTVVGKTLAPNLAVDVVDQFGNRITTDHSTATLTIADGPTSGTITGAATVSASSGVVTFKNLVLPLAGAYSLQITDASLADPTPVLFAETITQGVTTFSGVPSTLTRIFGQTVTLTPTLKSNAPSSVPFTGVATLVDSLSDVLGTVSLTAGGQAKFNISGIAPGTYLCNISYPGDANHTAVTSSAFTLQVNLAGSSTALVTSVNTLVFGQSLTLTATVNSSNAPGVVRTGSVSFYDGLTLLGTASLDGSSMASITLTPAAVGSHSFKAFYTGDGNFKISNSSSVGRTVNKDKTTIAFVSPPASPLPLNQTFNLDIHVSLLAPGVSTLNGEVTVKDNGKVLTTVNLDVNGDATLPGLSYTALSTHTLTAIYAGDVETLAATSLGLKLAVTP